MYYINLTTNFFKRLQSLLSVVDYINVDLFTKYVFCIIIVVFIFAQYTYITRVYVYTSWNVIHYETRRLVWLLSRGLPRG